jgi:hypothetical protein
MLWNRIANTIGLLICMTISDFLQVDIVINVAQGNLFHNGFGLGEVAEPEAK